MEAVISTFAKKMIFDFQKSVNDLNISINRAAYFLGFSVSSAESDIVNNFSLESHSKCKVVDPNLDPENSRKVKNAFKDWVTNMVVRDLIEAVAIFFDDLYIGYYFLEDELDQKKINQFQRKGIEEKLKILKEQFCVEDEYGSYFANIYRLRNCLTHRLGLVGHQDTQGKDHATYRYASLELEYHGQKTGKIYTPFGLSDPQEQFITPEPCRLKLAWSEKEKTIKKGEFIVLSPREASDIIVFVQTRIRPYIKQLSEKAKDANKTVE